jgi:amino acid transporter
MWDRARFRRARGRPKKHIRTDNRGFIMSHDGHRQAGGAPDVSDDVKILHSMGYAQELLRRMSGFSNFAISFSIICILAGGITSFQLAFSSVGGAGIGIGWPIGCLFALVVALAMAQIASAYPTAGGLYHWGSILGGRFWGWVTAWFNLLGLLFVVASVNVGTYVLFVNGLGPIFGIDPATLTVTHQVIGISLITLTQALFNHLGIRATTLLTDFSGYLIFAVAIVLTIAMLAYAPGPLEFGRLFTFTNNTGDLGGGVIPEVRSSIFVAFLLGLLLPVYTVTGFDASAHTSEETVDAARNVPRGMLQSVIWSGIFGYIMICAFVLAMPDPTAGAAQGGNVFYWLMDSVMPGWAKTLLFIGIVLANYLCALAGLTSTSRMTYAFARDGGLPFSNALRSVSPKFRTPAVAIWTTAVLSVLVTLYTPAFATLATACAVFLYISYAMPISAGILAHGKTWTTFGPFSLGAAFKPIALLAVIGTFVLFWIGIQPPNDKVLIITVAMIVVLGIFWVALENRRFQGPPVGEAVRRRQAEIAAAEQALGEAGKA